MTDERRQNDLFPVRLNHYLALCNYCSRRQADALIKAGKVKVNNKVAITGLKIMPTDIITVSGEEIKWAEKPSPIYLAFNKPKGIVCTTATYLPNNIVSFLGFKERIFPIGRLDAASHGLILLTNDGSIVNKVLRGRLDHEKEYIVRVDKKISDEFLQKMAGGLPILNTVTKKCEVQKLCDTTFRIVLTQGLNRQIRRMSEYLGYHVKDLKRVRVMRISLGNLKTGSWRYLSKAEIQYLKDLPDPEQSEIQRL